MSGQAHDLRGYLQHWLLNRHMQTVVVRFFELWGALDMPLLMKGLGSKSPRLQQIMAGVLGWLNKKGAIRRNEWGKWVVADWLALYRLCRHVRRLPPSGIERAKDVAREVARRKHEAK